MKRFHKIAAGALAVTLIATGAAEAAEGWARSSSWLRAGPGNSYPAITRVSAGEGLSVYGCLRSWSWCDVGVDGERGWFPGSRIALHRDGRRVELPGAAALLGLTILGFQQDVYWNDHYRGRRFDGRGWDQPRHVRPFRQPFDGGPVLRDHYRPGFGQVHGPDRMRYDGRPYGGRAPGLQFEPAPDSSRGK